jgi:hypothetical protein
MTDTHRPRDPVVRACGTREITEKSDGIGSGSSSHRRVAWTAYPIIGRHESLCDFRDGLKPGFTSCHTQIGHRDAGLSVLQNYTIVA